MIFYSDAALIRGIRQKNEACIRYLYREYFPAILFMVETNNGVYEDAEDVFQDGLVVLYRKVRKEKIRLSCSVKTYLYSVCKNIWLRRLERKSRMVLHPDVEVHEQVVEYHMKAHELREEHLERLRIFHHHFLSLPKDCQKILMMFFDKVPLKEIAASMGLKGENYVKSRKYMCKNLLRKKILSDPDAKCFISDEKEREAARMDRQVS
jgi:RNA polymerase sigma factor (sigma-70 family)